MGIQDTRMRTAPGLDRAGPQLRDRLGLARGTALTARRPSAARRRPGPVDRDDLEVLRLALGQAGHLAAAAGHRHRLRGTAGRAPGHPDPLRPDGPTSAA